MQRQVAEGANWDSDAEVYKFDVTELQNKRFLCSCGLSTKMPFCDGSHMKVGFKPVQIQIVGTTVEVRPRQEIEVQKQREEIERTHAKRTMITLGSFVVALGLTFLCTKK